MQIELAQRPCVEGDPDANLDSALAAIADRRAATELMIFPETHLTGFAEPDAVASRALTVDGAQVSRLVQASRDVDLAIAIGLLERRDAQVFNTTLLITPESGIAARYSKTHLWADERALVTAGDRLVCVPWRDRRIGLLICYDIEFAETARALASLDADLIVVTNGNMDPYGPVHQRAAATRAQDNQCFLAMCNRVGTGAGQSFAGQSAVFGPDGERLHVCGRDMAQAVVTLDFDALKSARKSYDYLADRRIDLEGRRDDGDTRSEWRLEAADR